MTDGASLILANDEVHELAEGPFWDPVRRRLLWVDIVRGLVLVGEVMDDGTVPILDRVGFGGTVGAVAVSEAGDWVVAGTERLLVRRPDGSVLEGPRLLPDEGGRRLNDGKPDPAGRYVVGSLRLEGDSEVEHLVVVDRDGRVAELDDDLTLSNGLGWTADGRTFYSVDTGRARIHRRAYDPATGAVGEREVFVETEGGHPDGMCLDAEDHLWVAIWGAGEVRRYSPGGELVTTIAVPAPQTTCVAFAGDDLGTLVITTATERLTDADRAANPGWGRMYTVRPGVTGLPQPLWGGFADGVLQRQDAASAAAGPSPFGVVSAAGVEGSAS